MGGGRDEMLDDVAFLERRPPDPTPPAPLPPVGVQRNALYVGAPRHGDYEVLVGDQILDVELTLVRHQPRTPPVAELLPYLLELLGNDRANPCRVRKDCLQLGN